MVVEVQFSGPQSAERPALLLTRLFQAGKVAVHPIALRRGRKRCSSSATKTEIPASEDRGVSRLALAEVPRRSSGEVSDGILPLRCGIVSSVVVGRAATYIFLRGCHARCVGGSVPVFWLRILIYTMGVLVLVSDRQRAAHNAQPLPNTRAPEQVRANLWAILVRFTTIHVSERRE